MPRAASLRDFVEVTKPKHQFVLFTCWVSMYLAGGATPWSRVLLTLLGTGLAVASSHVFNQIFDRHFDARMERTKDRPLASGRLDPKTAALFGAALGLLSLAVTAWATNALTVLLVIAGWFVYAVVYSYWLKPRTPWCTLVGGVSGAMPTLIGWAAATGSLGAPAVWLFLFMTLWQSPHFFALSLFRAEEYRRAGIPVVIVRDGTKATLRQMLGYTVVLVACSLLANAAGVGGRLFLAVALILGAVYIAGAAAASAAGEKGAAQWGKRLFHYSYAYMLLIFATAAVGGLH